MHEPKGTKPKRFVFVGGVILLGLLLFALYMFFAASPAREVIAHVGSEEITRLDADIRVRQLIVRASQGGGLSVPEDALFDRAIDQLIDESLVYQDARRNGFSANPEEVETRYEAARSAFDSEEAFLERMKENLLTPAIFRRMLERQITLFAYFEEEKRKKIQAAIDAGEPMVSPDGTRLIVTAERTPVTQEDIDSIIAEITPALKEEFGVEVFLD